MPGLALVIPGTGPGTGPIIPAALPSVGVSDYSHRYSGAKLTGNNGDAISTWADAGSSPAAMVPDWGAGTALVNKGGTFPYAALSLKALGNGIAEAGPSSFAVVFRKPTSGNWFFSAGGVLLTRTGGGAFRVSGAGVGAVGTLDLPGGSANWSCLVVSLTATTMTVAQNGVEVAGSVTPGTPQASHLGGFGGNADSSAVDIAEVVQWSNRALTSAERASVYAALKSTYSLP